MTVMNSPWDPRYENAFYLSVNADKNYQFFKDITDAQQFVENPKSEGKGVIFHVLPIQTVFNSPNNLSVQPIESVESPIGNPTEAETIEPEASEAVTEVAPETPAE